MRLTQDPNSGVVSVHQEDGSQVAFAPDGAGRFNPVQPRIRASLAEDSSGVYTFTRAKRIVYRFNPTGRLLSVADLNGDGVTLGYDQSGVLATVTDGAGRRFTVSVTGGHVTKVADSTGRAYVYAYSSGNLVSVTDPTNAVWTFTYDASHRLLTMLNPRQQGASSPSPLTNVYDSSGRVTKQTDFAGRATTLDYTSISGATTVTDPAGRVTVDYYSNGLRSKTTTAYGTASAATTSYAYDPTTLGVASVIDPLNHTTNYTYDAAGNTLTFTDPLNRKASFTYDGINDRLTATDAAGTTTTSTFDAAGNLRTVSTPLTNTSGTVIATRQTQYKHDDTAHPGDVTAVVSPNGNTTSYGYNSYGDRISVTAPPTPENSAGNKTTYGYDAVTGWRTSMTTARGTAAGANAADYTTTYGYDADGRPTLVRDPQWTSSTPSKHQTSMTYDPDGNLASSTDGNGHATSYAYDADGELLTTTLANATTRKQTWTPGGQLATSTDPAGHVTTNTYDEHGRLATVKDPLGRVVTYSYDAADNLALRVAPGATCTGTTPTAGCAKYTYDAANQLTSRSYADGKTTAVSAITYDADDRRTKQTDASGTGTTAYDNLGRVTSYQNGAGTTIGYGHDLDGNTTSLTYPGTGHTATYAYDAADRAVSMTDWNSNTVAFGYDRNSNPTTTTFPTGSGETDTTSYDTLDAVTGITDTRTASGTASTLAGFAYTRDGISNVTSTTTTGTGVSEAVQNYSHDTIDRLTSSGATSPATSYGYSASDDVTNRGTTSGAAASTQAFNAGDQLCWSSATTVASPACGTVPSGATTYTYDVNGNRATSKAGTATAATYGYDESQQLTKYTSPAGTATTYTYDANGLRQAKTTGSTTTRFTYDPQTGQLLSDGTNYYLHDNTGHPLEQVAVTGGTVTWLHHDQLGSTRLLTNTSGTVVGATTYDPYGAKKTSSGTVTTPLGWDGQYTDTETGFVYLRARYYDPATAQFLTLDPLRAATGTPYAYTHDQPLDRDDPNGLCDGFFGCAYSGLEGFANGVTFGGVAALDEAVSPGSTCTYDHTGLVYQASELAGTALLAIPTDGGALEVGATLDASAATASVSAESAAPSILARAKAWSGREYKIGEDFRVAPFGNRTGHSTGRFPHYHRRVTDRDGQTLPGQDIGRHRPWDSKSTDVTFWDRF